jgi:choline dehydrogenase-like flavoprotein
LPGDWIVVSKASDETMKAALDFDGVTEDDKKHLLDPETPHTETLIVYVPAGAAHADTLVPIDESHIASCVLGFATTSRGSITLKSSNPSDAPHIDPNYYATQTDRVALRAAVRQVLQLISTPDMSAVIESETPPPGYPPLHVNSTDEEIDARIRRAANTFYHPAGGNSMKKVVDTRLRVKGVKGLRVCDASVIPVSIAAHLQVPVITVAEKCADLIAEDRE